MVKIYHNPQCSKSREALEFLKNHTIDFEVVEYIKNGISFDELQQIISLLQIAPINLVRTNETLWKENYKGKTLTDDEIILAMAENPKLMQRPIIINNNQAVIGRPTENINQIL